MKGLRAVLVLSLVLPCLDFGQQAKNAPTEEELMKLENQWGEAVVKQDFDMLGRILADDYTGTDFEGTIWTKATAIAAFKSGEDVVTSATVDEMKVRTYGDAAVVIGRTTVQEKLKGRDLSGQYRFTDTWVRRGGRWQCIAAHGSKLPPPTARRRVIITQ